MPSSELNILLSGLTGKTDLEKLEAVNLFFNNRIQYVPDLDLWGVPEYWATPDELIDRGAGDCEDFAIAKYFSLIQAGVDESLLKIIYARLLTTGENHMALAYDDSLILDNLVDNIMTMTERSDLLPIVGFNRAGLWRYFRGKPKLWTRNYDRLVRWRGVLGRINGEGS